jgi:serine/threonine protein kinase/Tfp pilus assembly protein PilF
VENTLYIASRICAGLDYAHNLKDFQGNSLRIIHRDIGPHNIFITYDGQVKIIDFGIAKASSKNTMTQVGAIKGKIAYMSPEQATGKPIDHRSDIFSIGIVLYEMVTNKQMFEGDTFEAYAKVREAKFEPLEKVKKDLPLRFYKILKRALAKEPAQRYQSADEMLIDVDQCISELSVKPSERSLTQYMRVLFEDEMNTEKDVMRAAASIHNGEMQEIQEDGETSEIIITKNMPPKRKWRRYLYATLLIIIIVFGMIFSMTHINNPESKLNKIKIALADFHLFSDMSRISDSATDSNAIQTNSVYSRENFPGSIFMEYVHVQPDLIKVEKGNLLIESERFEEAIVLFEDMLKNNPSMTEKIIEPYSLALQGQASKLKKTNQKEAEALLLKSVMLKSENAQGHYLLGRLYTEQKNNADAIASYQKAIDLDQQMTKAFFNLGYLYTLDKKYTKAEEMYERVIELSPPFIDEALYNLSFVQVKLGKPRQGIKTLERAIKANPENKQAKFLLQQLKQKSGKER